MLEKIVKNSSFLIVSQVLVRVISFFYGVAFLPAFLGVDRYGLYIVGLSLFSLFASISDFGLSRYMMREVARQEEQSKTLFSQILTIRLLVILIASALYALTLIVFDKNADRLAISLLALLALIPQTAVLTLENFFMATQRVSVVAKGILILSLGTSIAGVILVKQGLGVFGAFDGMIIGYVIYLAYLSANFKKYNHFTTSVLNSKILKSIALGSLPYAILGILGLIFFRIDSLMLSYFRGSYETGIYGLAYKFLEAIVFIPSALATIIFPIFSRLHTAKPHEIKPLLFKIAFIMGGIGLCGTLGFIFILPFVISHFLPSSYLAAIATVQILSFSIPFMFIHIPLSQVLLSSDSYIKPILVISFINVGFNVIANLIFIPQFGLVAAAWITVLSDIFSLMMLIYGINRYVYGQKGRHLL